MGKLDELLIKYDMQITSPNRDDCSACSGTGLWVAISSKDSESVYAEGETPLEAAKNLELLMRGK